MEHVNDVVLFQRIRQDNRLVLNTLFAQYYQKLCRFACTCSLTPELAEEVVSDVFFFIWKNRERLDIHSNVRAYLYKSVKNAALAALNKQQPVTTLEDEYDTPDASTPELALLYTELYEQFNRVVETLPARCRQIFVMNRLDGLKYKEIASVLSISEKTVEHQMVKALDIVRTALTPHRRVIHNSVTVS